MGRIGKNIKKARSEKGYTQEQLAQKLSVTRNTISNYETGHSNPDIEMLQTEGFQVITQVDPNMVIKKNNKNDDDDEVTEVQDGWKGHILPFELVQERLMPEDV